VSELDDLRADYPAWLVWAADATVHAWLPGPVDPWVGFTDDTADGLRCQLLEHEFPGWHAWVGVRGVWYARRLKTSPPVTLRDAAPGGLRAQIERYVNGK